ncbi:MAG TPA: ribosome biogenesis GTP-binding protein YihA/YsxC [Saprospiraceae bacterium]|nr:ribosome biogenesis GTP-binding protein YihA/YsxC [Saprospiraceae bacterium]HMQ84500.1 ribosome biogenesis GTP-binding protein YihA/YsxC [Saprospiraceae bacterium]
MTIHQVDFVGSFPSDTKCPQDERPEYAFIGRSNVGKSSLINFLTGRKNIAHTSNKPGKTQLLNYYLVNQSWYLVDLPGYGYAKISKIKRKEWEKMIQNYLVRRDNLQCAFVLIDANIPPQKIDVEFINWLGEMAVPFVLVYTKTDRLKPEQIAPNIEAIRAELLQYWETLPEQFITSAVNKIGDDDILNFIAGVNDRIGHG